jgi:tRNA(fMet)-specific endonuclease VapC
LGVILDTNALSAFLDGEETAVAHLREADAVYLPVIVLGEYRFGLHGSRWRKEREDQLLLFARACTVLAVLESTTPCYAAIRHRLRKAGTPIPENDIWIAALAMEYGLPILSDDRHFDRVNQVRQIAWSGSGSHGH